MEGNGRWSVRLLGALIGLIVGIVLVTAGTLNAFLVFVFIVLGLIIANYLAGGIDLDQFYDRYLRGRTRGSRK